MKYQTLKQTVAAALVAAFANDAPDTSSTYQMLKQKASGFGNKMAVTTAVALPAVAFANDQPDVSNITNYIGYATAAIVAIGTAKLIPAAAMWLYSSLGSMVKRG